MSSPSDWARLISQVHTFARVQSRGSMGKPSAPYLIFFGGGSGVCPEMWLELWWRLWLLLHRRSFSLESTLTADRSNGGTRHFAALSTCIALVADCLVVGIWKSEKKSNKWLLNCSNFRTALRMENIWKWVMIAEAIRNSNGTTMNGETVVVVVESSCELPAEYLCSRATCSVWHGAVDVFPALQAKWSSFCVSVKPHGGFAENKSTVSRVEHRNWRPCNVSFPLFIWKWYFPGCR